MKLANGASGLLLLLLGAACVTDPIPDIPKDAIVTYETVRFHYEADEEATEPVGVGAGLTTVAMPLVGERSDNRQLALGVILSTNTMLFDTLASARLLTRLAPLRYEDGQWWQWRFERNAVVNRFTLSALGDGTEGPRFGYLLERGSSDAALASAFDGEFERFTTSDDEIRRGQGVLRYHFAAIDPVAGDGEMALAFRSRGGVRQVHVFLREVRSATLANPVSAAYRYVQLAGGGGELVFATTTDFLDDGLPHEEVALRTRWLPSGEGRVLGVVSGGSLQLPEVLIEECWSTDGTTVWLDTTPDLSQFEGGSVEACAAELRALVLERPLAEPPGPADPPLPEPHPDE